MKLLSLHIENFGGLHDHDETFEAGLNTRLRPNGWGKSTLAVFVKAMLYGLPATTRRSLIENERKRYAPWQGGAWGGSVDIEVGGEQYRIERFFGAKEAEDTLTVLTLPSGQEAEVPWAAAPGEGLFGVDAAAYERSTYLSQRPEEAAGDGSLSIQTKLNALVDATDDLGNYDRAMDLFDRRRRSLQHLSGGGGEIARQREQLAQLERALEAGRARRGALDACRARLSEIEQQLDVAKAEAGRLREAEHTAMGERERWAVARRLQELEQETAAAQTEAEATLRELGGRLPTEQEIEEAERAIARRESARAALTEGGQSSLAAQTDETSEELEALRRQLPGRMPAADRVQNLRDAARAYHRAAILAPELAEAPTAPALGLAWVSARQGELTRRMDQLSAQQNEIDALPQPRQKSLLPALLLAVAGIACLIGGVLWWPMLLAAGGLLITALVVVYLRRANARRCESERAEQAARREEIRQEMELVRGEIASHAAFKTAAEAGVEFEQCFAACFPGEPAPDAAEAAGEVERLLALCQRMQDLQAAADRRARQQTEQTLRRAAQREQEYGVAEVALKELTARYPNLPGEGSLSRRLAEGRSRAISAQALAQRKQEALTAARAALSEQDLPLPTEEPAGTEDLTAARCAAEETVNRLLEAQMRERQNEERLAGDEEEMDLLEGEREALLARIQEDTRTLDAVVAAQKYLKTARERLSSRYLDTMQQSFGRYMTILTEAETPAFTMDNQFRVKLRAAGVGRPAEAFNVGMRRMIGFCERLALLDAMFEGERPFLVLDDPFTDLDDDTVARAGVLLAALSERYQLLYLSCHSSRAFDASAEKREENK